MSGQSSDGALDAALAWALDIEGVQALIDSLPVGVLHWDAARTPFYISNPAVRRILGVAPDQPFPARGSGMGGIVEPFRSQVAEAVRRGEPFDGNVAVATPSGELRHLELRVRGNSERGWSITRLISATVTEGVPETLAPIEEEPAEVPSPRFSPLFEHSRVAMFLLDPSGLVLTANPAAALLLGRESIAELLEHRFDVRDFVTDEALRTSLLEELRERGYVAGREVPFTRVDGETAWVLLDLAVNPTDGFIEVVATDIGEERSGRIALQNRERRFRRLFENAIVGMWQADINASRVLKSNLRLAQILGYDTLEQSDAKWRTDFPHLQWGLDVELRNALANGVSHFERERETKRPDGSTVWTKSFMTFNPEEGTADGIVLDITAEREAERALRESELRYRSIFENAVVGVIQLGADGALQAANRFAARIFGYASAEEFTAQWMTNHQYAARVLRQEIDRLALAPTHESEVELEVQALDGSTRCILVRSHLDVDAGTTNAFLRDVTAERTARAESERLIRELDIRATERRQLVRRLLHAGEEERRQIAHEIHDGPAQLLAGSLMFLTSAQQERQRGRSEQEEDYLERGTDYLRIALDELRRVMAHLRPAVLDDLGLVSAIQSTAEAAVAPYGMSARVEQLGEAEHLEQSTEMVLFRVAQEGTTNAGKHSNGTTIEITIDYRDPSGVTLTVTDDGEGFDTGAVFAEADGHHLGLLGLQERVYLVGGSFAIMSAPEHGTRITVTVPRSAGTAPPGQATRD